MATCSPPLCGGGRGEGGERGREGGKEGRGGREGKGRKGEKEREEEKGKRKEKGRKREGKREEGKKLLDYMHVYVLHISALSTHTHNTCCCLWHSYPPGQDQAGSPPQHPTTTITMRATFSNRSIHV